FPQGVEVVTGSEAGTFTYRTDHLGSIREVVDDQGNLTARFDYSPWGEMEAVSGSFELDFGFTGHFIHQPTGLYLAPFRAYDAGLGRWMSREPLGALGPDGPNLYQYVQNNPLNLVDHTGLSATSPEPLVMIGEVDLPGGALERAGRIINAGDRMAEELIKRSKPGFFQRCQEGFRSALDVPAKVDFDFDAIRDSCSFCFTRDF
ncbi:MAG: RHS repeat domain-containing protein, partial [Puniceicoccaceae bacterium]